MKTSLITLSPLLTEEDYDKAQARLIELTKIQPKTPAEKAEFKALATLSLEWEEEHFLPPVDLDAVDFIRFIMESNGLRNKDMVPYLGSLSRVSDILGRKRALTIGMIRALNEGLGIPLDVLIKESRLERAHA